jgi:hypothetical protein
MRHIAGGEVDVGGCVRPHEGEVMSGVRVRNEVLVGDLDRDGECSAGGKATTQS